MKLTVISALLLAQSCVAFNTPSQIAATTHQRSQQQQHLGPQARVQKRPSLADAAHFLVSASTCLHSTAATASGDDGSKTEEGVTETKPLKNAGKTLADLRQEGGMFTISTPIGALNPFAIYYGFMSVFLGIPWFISLKWCQFMYFITRSKFDAKRRLPVFFSHVWGTALMRLSRSYPEMENLHILQDLYAKKQPAMFVANHNSWMDIPFLGATVGWRNYKLVAKKELSIIPILGSAIKAGGNIMIDRTNRRSQLKTLKDGIAYLKEGIHLCTFPEGTRSKSGRLLPFKNGAFKMAYKAGAPVVPISIVNSGKVMPPGWMFAMRPSYKNAKIIVHEPVETEGRTEEEVAAEVRRRMIEGLPDYQRPLEQDTA